MIDTMTATKAVGAGCGALLVFLLGGWAAESIYASGGGHGEQTQAYVIDTGASEAAAEPAAEVDFATVLASADAAAGEKVFGKCRACHKLDGSNSTGPSLNGIVDAPKAAHDGFSYSATLAGMAGDTWTPENLNAFLANPKAYAPGTKMSFAGLPKVEDRAALVAYLATTTK